MTVTVLIPVYKNTMSRLEALSLVQCLRILKAHRIILVTHKQVDTAVYKNQFETAGIDFHTELFDKTYFDSVFSYSRLLMSREFYQRFSDSQYVFIYQLDGFVFRDELEYWCSQGYDYIGAPWFKHYGKQSNKLWKVGNGGVSLRKVEAYLKRLDASFPLASSWYYIKSIRLKKLFPMGLRTLRMLFILIFAQKSVEYIVEHFTDERVNEDCFWAEAFQHTSLKMRIPDVLTGARFCVEKHPSEVYKLLGEKLPFSCHAFDKYEYDTFWKNHIS
jgi:hypothetical protein